MSPSIFTRSISLGMSGTFSVPGNVGISPDKVNAVFRLFRGCEIEAGAALLPDQVFRTAISRSFSPLKGARAINLSCQATYHESPRLMPPTVDVNLSRQLGPRQWGTLSWSSGTIFWPSRLSDALAPFVSIGPDPNATINISRSSSCGLAFTSYASYAGPSDQNEPGEENESGDLTYRQASSSSGETWGFEFGSSPYSGNFSISYGRNVFRGQVKAPVLSQWSADGHHRSQVAAMSQPHAVRLDVHGSLGLDGTIGWMVQGSRHVGEFSRIGVGIGVQGPRGLVVSVSWSRLGQGINFPIFICPLDLVDADIVIASIALPWTLYTIFYYGLASPRAKRRYNDAVRERRKELEKLVGKRKAQSEQVIDLMEPQVRRRQSREKEKNGLVVLEARYGASPRSKFGRKRQRERIVIVDSVDVTIPVARLVHQGQLFIARGVNKVHSS